MTRNELLASVCATVVPITRLGTAQDPACAATTSLLGWRYVVMAGPYRVGVLSSAGVAVIEAADVAPVRVNLPRASPGARGWVSAVSPATPYIIPERRFSDVLITAAPDEITMAVALPTGVIFGVETPPFDMPVAYMPSFLIRITPSTSGLETFALPPSFRGVPTAVYQTGSVLTVVNGAGGAIKIAE